MQDNQYPFDSASAWLEQFLSAYPSAQALLCRAVAVTPDVIRKSTASPQRLSRIQWEILRKATRGAESPWDRNFEASALAVHRDGLKAAMRAQHNKTPPALVAVRLQNMKRLTAHRGAVGKIAELLGVAYQGISALGVGSNTLGTHKARQLEGAMGLPAGWFDDEGAEIPAATVTLLTAAGATASARDTAGAPPQPEATGKVGGLPLLSSALQQAVLEKFVTLSRARLISDHQAYELLGTLMAYEKAASPSVAS